MSLTISNTSLIDELDVWEANITPLPSVDYTSLSYSETNKDLWVCQNTDAVEEMELLFTKSVIEEKISQPYSLVTQIFKNKPGFELVPHIDNNEMLGVIIINLLTNETSTEFYNMSDVKNGQAPLTKNTGVMYLNNYDFKHGYNNVSSADRYICICIIYKKQ